MMEGSGGPGYICAHRILNISKIGTFRIRIVRTVAIFKLYSFLSFS